jgi:DNA-binding PadR family transcriptional regulator
MQVSETAINLTPTSYIVLGLLELAGEATPYDLKRAVAESIGDFWSVQHAQLYTEPERLTHAGLLNEDREEGGRRRKRYTLTDTGRAALSEWRSNPTDAFTELRDPGLLQLFFGTDPAALAARQLAVHSERLARYEAIQAATDGAGPAGPRLALESGIGHEREWVRFWSELADGTAG